MTEAGHSHVALDCVSVSPCCQCCSGLCRERSTQSTKTLDVDKPVRRVQRISIVDGTTAWHQQCFAGQRQRRRVVFRERYAYLRCCLVILLIRYGSPIERRCGSQKLVVAVRNWQRLY